MQAHMFLAALTLPILLMYFVSGMLYTFDIKGHIEKQKFNVVLDAPARLNLDFFADVAKKNLIAHALPIPDGDMTLRKKKSSYTFRWGGLQYAVSIKTTKTPNVLTMTVRERSLLTQMMRIHRADAGAIFKAIPLILLIGMLFILLSGIYMGLNIPKFRNVMLYTMGFSTAAFLLVFVL